MSQDIGDTTVVLDRLVLESVAGGGDALVFGAGWGQAYSAIISPTVVAKMIRSGFQSAMMMRLAMARVTENKVPAKLTTPLAYTRSCRVPVAAGL